MTERKLVPLDPTPDMHEAAIGAYRENPVAPVYYAVKAAIAAAPNAAATQEAGTNPPCPETTPAPAAAPDGVTLSEELVEEARKLLLGWYIEPTKTVCDQALAAIRLAKRVEELEKLATAISRDCNDTALERNDIRDKLAAAERELAALKRPCVDVERMTTGSVFSGDGRIVPADFARRLAAQLRAAQEELNASHQRYRVLGENVSVWQRECTKLQGELARYRDAKMPEEPERSRPGAPCLPCPWEYADALRTYAARMQVERDETIDRCANIPLEYHRLARIWDGMNSLAFSIYKDISALKNKP